MSSKKFIFSSRLSTDLSRQCQTEGDARLLSVAAADNRMQPGQLRSLGNPLACDWGSITSPGWMDRGWALFWMERQGDACANSCRTAGGEHKSVGYCYRVLRLYPLVDNFTISIKGEPLIIALLIAALHHEKFHINKVRYTHFEGCYCLRGHKHPSSLLRLCLSAFLLKLLDTVLFSGYILFSGEKTALFARDFPSDHIQYHSVDPFPKETWISPQVLPLPGFWRPIGGR